MKKTITIHYEDQREGTSCDVETTDPFNLEELIYGCTNFINLFCQNTGTHPIQVASHLQYFIVNSTFNKSEESKECKEIEEQVVFPNDA